MSRETNAKRTVLLKAINILAREAEMNLSKLDGDFVEFVYECLERGPLPPSNVIVPALRMPTGKDLV